MLRLAAACQKDRRSLVYGGNKVLLKNAHRSLVSMLSVIGIPWPQHKFIGIIFYRSRRLLYRYCQSDYLPFLLYLFDIVAARLCVVTGV